MRHTTITSVLSALLFVMGFCSNAHAENGLYLGASLGNAKVGTKDTNETLHLSGDDAGYKLFAGFKFTLLAVEAGYVDFGVIEQNNSSIDVTGFNAFGKLSFGLGPVELFGKAGGFAWESNYKDAQDQFENDGFDPVIGFGAAFNLGGVGVRAEYEYYDIKEFDEVSMISIGVICWIL